MHSAGRSRSTSGIRDWTPCSMHRFKFVAKLYSLGTRRDAPPDREASASRTRAEPGPLASRALDPTLRTSPPALSCEVKAEVPPLVPQPCIWRVGARLGTQHKANLSWLGAGGWGASRVAVDVGPGRFFSSLLFSSLRCGCRCGRGLSRSHRTFAFTQAFVFRGTPCHPTSTATSISASRAEALKLKDGALLEDSGCCT